MYTNYRIQIYAAVHENLQMLKSMCVLFTSGECSYTQ